MAAIIGYFPAGAFMFLCYSVCRMPGEPRLPKIRRRRSGIHGYGVFTLEPITKNTRVIDYAGELINHKESLKRETKYLERGEIWCFTVNRRWVRDANVGGNVARFINHSCTPNCYSQIVGRTVWIRASRNIEAGEELSYDYYTDGEKIIQCRCTPGCTRKL
jgi:SET domain-containing protein